MRAFVKEKLHRGNQKANRWRDAPCPTQWDPDAHAVFCVRCKKGMEGLAPIDTLRGDRVQVILDRILAQERKLQFSIVEEDLPLSGKTAANSLPQGKEERPRLAGAIVQREKKARQVGQAALRSPGPQRHLQRIIAG